MAQSPERRSGRPETNEGVVGAFRAARLFGIDILVHWSWLFIFVLVTWSLESSVLPEAYPDWTARQRWAVGAFTALLFFGSVLAHELAHAIVARRRGVTVAHITLYVFGGASALTSEPKSARDEFWIAIVGPLTSLGAAVLFGLIWLAARAAEVRPVYVIAGYLAYINLVLAIFNMLPGFPLDGGRVLRAAAWGAKRNMLAATKLASTAGRVVAGLLIVIGLATLFAGRSLSGFWFIFLGWFLWNAAETSYHQLLIQTTLHGLTIGPLVDRNVTRVPPDCTLQQLADEYVLGRNQRVFFVTPAENGDILGLISLTDLRKAPREEWERVSVYRAMTPRDRLVTVTPATEAMEALRLMAEHNVNQLPVISSGEAIGLLTRAALVQAIQFRGEFRPAEADVSGSDAA